jgi:nucleotide-binding universal stress UspA family protein
LRIRPAASRAHDATQPRTRLHAPCLPGRLAAQSSYRDGVEPTASVVCGLDHSTGARAAAHFATDLAARLTRRLVLVHAIQPPLPQSEPGVAAGTTALGTTNWDVIDDLRRAGADLLEETAQELGAAGLEVVTELKFGDASNVVAAAAEQHEAEFLVVGSRGLGSVSALILGSVSLRLAVHAPCPTMIVPELDGTVGDRPILCAVDDSEEARAALAIAVGLSERLNARLMLAHVTPENALAGAGEELLARLLVETGLGTSVERTLVRGEAAEAIVDTATSAGAGVIVLGSRGRGALTSAALGSVSSAVATHAPCTVTIVRARPAGWRTAEPSTDRRAVIGPWWHDDPTMDPRPHRQRGPGRPHLRHST